MDANPLVMSHDGAIAANRRSMFARLFTSVWCWIIILFCSACLIALFILLKADYEVSVTVTRLHSTPIFNSTKSSFDYNYNAAYIPFYEANLTTTHGLAMRCQDHLPNEVYEVGPSYIVLTKETVSGDWQNIESGENVLIAPTEEGYNELGAEDPRVFHYPPNGFYYMFYTAVTNCSTGRHSDLGDVCARLALAVSPSGEPDSWTDHGPIFGYDDQWSKSGAMILDKHKALDGDAKYIDTHYLLWGDSNISIAVSENLVDWRKTDNVLIATRDGMFDSYLVESGPPPVKLSDGNYLFLYNSARDLGIDDTPRPNWTLEYNMGFVVLDGEDPTRVLYRTSEPFFSPSLDWEKCDNSTSITGLMPKVVFTEGLRPVPGETDTFIMYYQGCDSYLSEAKLKFHVQGWF